MNTSDLPPRSWFEETKALLGVYWEATPWHVGGEMAASRLEKGIES